MKRTDLAYLAGIFDGEGTINIIRRNPTKRRGVGFHLNVELAMKEKYVPQLFQFIFGGNLRFRENRGSFREGTLWDWKIQAKSAVETLKTLKPFLRLKYKEAELGIEFGEDRPLGGIPNRYCTKRIKQVAVEEAQYILMRSLKH